VCNAVSLRFLFVIGCYRPVLQDISSGASGGEMRGHLCVEQVKGHNGGVGGDYFEGSDRGGGRREWGVGLRCRYKVFKR